MKASIFLATLILLICQLADAGDENHVYNPCSDAKIQKNDGFSFGFAFSAKENFISTNKTSQLSPCDKRLDLHNKGAQLAIFRPKVDEISLLIINSSNFNVHSVGGYMVAFAGRRFAARSVPVLVADNDHTITSFTLVLEFHKGTLENLFFKHYGCGSCTGKSAFCLNKTDCAVPTSKCKNGNCDMAVQVAFSGTDKNQKVLNSWFEVSKLKQYSLTSLFSNLKDSISNPFGNLL